VFRTSQEPRAGSRKRASLVRREVAGRRELGAGAGAPTRRRAGPGRRGLAPVQDQADPTVRVSRPRDPAPAGGTGDRRAAEPGARSTAGSGGRASAPRPRGSRSSGRRSSGRRSSGRRSWPPGSRVRRCPARRWAGSRRPDSREAAGSVPAGVRVSGPAGAASLRVAVAAGRTRPRRHPARSGPGLRLAGRRGVRPGVFARAGRSHRGPGRCRHVPPGTPPGPCCPAAPQDTPYLTSVGRQKSPVGPGRPIVINCTYSHGIEPMTPGIEMRRVTQPSRDRNRPRPGILSMQKLSAERPWCPGSSG
jgi:hypothetical protein